MRVNIDARNADRTARAKNNSDGGRCAIPTCRNYSAWRVEVSRLGRCAHWAKNYCDDHAAKFAKSHGIDISEPPLNVPDSLVGERK